MRLLLAILLVCMAGRAEIIDRIAVTIEYSVIAESEILRQIRVTAFLNDEKPEFTAVAKQETADRLIEQALIRREMQLSRISVNPEAAAETRYKELRARFASEQAYQDKLQEYNLTDEDIRSALRWQVTLLEFIERRFQPGIQVPEEEIRDYYEREVKPVAAQRPGEPLSYDEARPEIEAILISQRVDNALDRWLGQARTQLQIRFKQEVFR